MTNISPGYDGSILLCPYCKEGHLHHTRVEIYSRKEDASSGLLVDVSDLVEQPLEPSRINVIPNSPMKNNPSLRRGGLRITFDCECCPETSRLIVVQHKGNTFVEWEE
jgi:hypothetical protein